MGMGDMSMTNPFIILKRIFQNIMIIGDFNYRYFDNCLTVTIMGDFNFNCSGLKDGEKETPYI